MLLDDLVGVIETIKGRISTHRSALSENETRTRMALIDPLLQALGWDTTDPAVVRPEYQANKGKADYALLGPTGQPSALIEAKRLDQSLENHEKQIFDYAWDLQVKYAGLTDGNHWYFVDLSKFTDSDKTILQLSLTDTPAHEAALKLLLLWRSNLSLGQPVAANAPLIASFEEPKPASPSSNASSASLPLSPNPATTSSGNWIPLNQLDEVAGQKAPSSIRCDGSDARSIKNWWQVLFEVANWLVESGTLTANQLPIKGLGFINSSPLGPNGQPFKNPRGLSGGVHLNAHGNAKHSVNRSKSLLERFGVNPNTVELRF